MKKVKNPKVGQLVLIPFECWDSRRSGWNGWTFRVGTIENLYTSKTGKACATVKFCTSTKSMYEMFPHVETRKGFVLDHVFEYNFLDLQTRDYKKLKVAEENGEKVCWSEDAAFLIANGFIKE